MTVVVLEDAAADLEADKAVQPTGANCLAKRQIECDRRLAPVAGLLILAGIKKGGLHARSIPIRLPFRPRRPALAFFLPLFLYHCYIVAICFLYPRIKEG
jgi:hypothetical protein